MLTPELIAPDRVEELLAGAVPDTEAEANLQGLARELRSTGPVAQDELRANVRALGSPPPPRHSRFGSRRRVALVLASLVIAAAAASIFFGDLPPGNNGSTQKERTLAGEMLAPLRATERNVPPALDRNLRAQQLLSGRAQHVGMWIELRVPDADRLSAAAQEAMRITRESGGFVAASTVGSSADEGRAELALRIPVARVDDAAFRLSQLGTVTSQRVVTEDRQAAIDSLARRIERLRRDIRITELRLESGTLGTTQQLELEIRLERLRGQLASARRSNTRLVSDAATAQLALVLHTEAATSGKTDKSGVAGIVGDALHVLGRVGALALFAAIVLSPLVALALLSWGLRRRFLRREEARLLEQSSPTTASPEPPRS